MRYKATKKPSRGYPKALKITFLWINCY